MTLRLLLAVGLWVLSGLLVADNPPSNILMVGNSFTFYNNGIHTHLRRMLQESEPDRKPPFRLKSLTLSGGSLNEHAAGLDSALQTWDWDIVILQGHSLEAFDPKRVPGFMAAADQLSKRVSASGAKPAFFMTWAYDGRRGMLSEIQRNYTRAASENKALLIPVGEAFDAALESLSGVDLFEADGKHPSLEGTYLAACTFYASLLGQSAEPLQYTAGLAPELADQLCRVAWLTVEEKEHEN